MSLQYSPIELELIDDDSSSHTAVSPLPAEVAAKKWLRQRHWSMLVVSVVVLVAAFALSLQGMQGQEKVAWQGVDFPVLCGSRAWLGIECPGCGLTRSFVALGEGDLKQSLQYHRVGWLIWLAVVMQIPFRLYSLWELQTSLVQRRWPTYFGSFLITVLIGNWIWQLLWS